jgi:hypothetical protein
MASWEEHLKYSPIKPLLSSSNKAISYFAKRDLLDKTPDPLDIWSIPEARKILQKQRDNGSWKPVRNVGYPKDNKVLVETYRNLRVLVRRYELTKKLNQIEKVSQYLFSWQTSEGDFRGFIGDQYAPYYTGETMAILILAGYTEDPRILKGFKWLLSVRQDDGGWTIPILTHKLNRETGYRATSEPWETYQPVRSMPFSHNWTDMVLRAFAVHPTYRHRSMAHYAARLLKSRFFKPDVYGSYRDKEYWTRFRFWWPNIVTSLDSLSRIGLRVDDPDVMKAVRWLIENQLPDGLWKTSYKRGDLDKDTPKERENKHWLTLQVCRILKRLNE